MTSPAKFVAKMLAHPPQIGFLAQPASAQSTASLFMYNRGSRPFPMPVGRAYVKVQIAMLDKGTGCICHCGDTLARQPLQAVSQIRRITCMPPA